MRFYGKVQRIENPLKFYGTGSDKGLVVELNSGGRNPDYTIKFEAIDSERHKLVIWDNKEKKEILYTSGNSTRLACKHELDRYNKCIVCGKIIVNS